MDYLLFYFWLATAFIIFLYSLNYKDSRSSIIFISMMLFFATGVASWDITSTHIFYDETLAETVVYTHNDYSTVSSYLGFGMGLLSGGIGFVRIFPRRISDG